MAESTRLVDVIQGTLDAFLDERESELTSIAHDLRPFVDFSRDLLRGGKRFRALFCYWGNRAVTDTAKDDSEPLNSNSEPLDTVVLAASALEMFHAAALVHDDIIDNSATRRGLPAVHERFVALHHESGWIGDGAHFGASSAMLAGDLLLAWSDQLFTRALEGLSTDSRRTAARGEFTRMRTEVMLGQYLDILEEQSWSTRDESDLLSRAQRVIVYKSAKYSIEAPLTIGAALGGGSPEQLDALRKFGLPLGVAYQLRDDLLGVFGDPETTGKPAGDDLREGKRTVLVAVARTELPPSAVAFLDEHLGNRSLTEEQVRMLQSALRDSGAVERIEKVIELNAETARAAIVDAPVSTAAKRELTTLVDSVTTRSS
ncbi:MAG TPA: polyprenyl synthetase family protein [Terrimesophilobacter sp.]|nr:polyprenyl synthetase family protein [Terrimesophilobacter sp.]HRP99231.1 polyprenyl synthetase family protein [Terrimesophilobacter sp.]